jgi:aminoglycoside phosphotransferase (APT) family kinase protein
MTDPSHDLPSKAAAATLVLKLLSVQPRQATRFRTGGAHYVYDVTLPDQQHVVVRMAATGPASLHGAVYWAQRLRPFNIPLPAILGDDRDARHTPFPALILEHLPGTDLGHVYHLLSHTQKANLAVAIAQIQQHVGTLPRGPGYGYAVSYDDPGLLPTWADVLEQSLTRSQQRIARLGRVSVTYVDRVRALLPRFSDYLARIPPTAFLDDTTTKNVLIRDGRLSGIVDVDYVCFGDPLSTVALTRMALLSMGADLEYTEAWCAALALDAHQRAALTLYTCMFCVDFLSEVGHIGNHNTVTATDDQRITQLRTVFERLMRAMG